MSDLFHPELVLRAYEEGFFPMAESRYGEIYWHSPDPRAIIPLSQAKPPRSLRQKLKRGMFEFSINSAFPEVIKQCASRDETWISSEIIDVYVDLNLRGFAHSVETWHEGELVGGLYGVAMGGGFFGESMFNKIDDAAKAAFYKLISHMIEKDYILLDSQYINAFTRQLGAVEVSRAIYMALLEKALRMDRTFDDTFN